MNVHEERWAKFDAIRAEREWQTDEKRLAELNAEEDALREQGVIDLLREDMTAELSWWWLSFVDTKTDTFLGVAIVEAGGVMEAALAARLRGCNPGGEVACYPLHGSPPEQFQYRLLSKDEALSLQEGDFT